MNSKRQSCTLLAYWREIAVDTAIHEMKDLFIYESSTHKQLCCKTEIDGNKLADSINKNTVYLEV